MVFGPFFGTFSNALTMHICSYIFIQIVMYSYLINRTIAVRLTNEVQIPCQVLTRFLSNLLVQSQQQKHQTNVWNLFIWSFCKKNPWEIFEVCVLSFHRFHHMKNAFYLIDRTPFVLEVFTFFLLPSSFSGRVLLNLWEKLIEDKS